MPEGTFYSDFGYSLSYETVGEGAERVLFVMGFACNRSYWGRSVDELHSSYPGKYTTCVFDQRGVGRSTDSLCAKTSTTTFARDILGLLLHLGWIDRTIPVHLVGWSMGGFACLEFLGWLLTETNHTLNVCSLTLANTGHKMTLPPASGLYDGCMAVLKTVLSLPTRGQSIVPHAVSLHFSAPFLAGDARKSIEKDYYATRSPFDKILMLSARTLLGHVKAVLTHHVTDEKMSLIRDSGLPILAIVSTEDKLIHPTASINLANSLRCPFSYLPGGHMSHIEHPDVFISQLVALWDRGCGLKFPHLMRPVKKQSANPLGARMQSAPDIAQRNPAIPRPLRSWPDDMEVKHILHKMMGRMDADNLIDIERLKHPGRLIVMPVLLAPLLLRMISRMRKKDTLKEKLAELPIVLYVLVLLLIVQETARIHG